MYAQLALKPRSNSSRFTHFAKSFINWEARSFRVTIGLVIMFRCVSSNATVTFGSISSICWSPYCPLRSIGVEVSFNDQRFPVSCIFQPVRSGVRIHPVKHLVGRTQCRSIHFLFLPSGSQILLHKYVPASSNGCTSSRIRHSGGCVCLYV